MKLNKTPCLLNTEGFFYHCVSGYVAHQKTWVRLSHQNDSLIVHFDCYDNPYLDHNIYMEDNAPLYLQEVFEVFIAYGKSAPKQYLEVEVNPNGATFIAAIRNENGVGNCNEIHLLTKKDTNITCQVNKKKKEQRWFGQINIPFDVINAVSLNEETPLKHAMYRANFFRIVAKKQHEAVHWKNDMLWSDYLCLSPTYTQKKPNFHQVDAMITLSL